MSKGKVIVKICEQCNQEFTALLSDIKRKVTRFCSRKCYFASRTSKLEDNIRIDDKTGCHIWTRATSEGGYGIVTRNNKTQYAHRHFWELKNGAIPDGLCVLHKCDCRPCCNVDHLFLGDYQDNSDDMISKNRHCKGEDHHSAKLKKEEVLLIRQKYATGKYTYKKLSDIFGVNFSVISEIVKKTIWKHI